jgi:hypothetical protein
MKLSVSSLPVVTGDSFSKVPLLRVIADHTASGDTFHPSRGVVVVIAGTQGGKSKAVGRLNEVLSERGDVKLAHFSYGEPTVDKYANQLSAIPLVTEEQLIHAVQDVLAQGATHIIIDSIRLMQYEQEGAATSGGMSTGTFSLLTRLSTLCYDKGITLIVPLNPNVKDDLYPVIRKNIEGSVHTVIDLEDNEMKARELDRQSVNYHDADDFLKAFYSEKQVKSSGQSYEVRRRFNATTSEVQTISSQLVDAVSPEDATESIEYQVAPGQSIKQIKGQI